MLDVFKLIMSNVWVILKPMVLAFLSKSGTILLEVATEVVKNLAAQDLSSSDKREQAFKTIKSTLKSRKVEVTDSLINAAIEIAVQKIK